MKGKIIADWTKVDPRNPESRRLMLGALQHFVGASDLKEVRKAAAQHFATTGDFPTSVLELIEKYGLEANYDNGWEQVFEVRDFTGSNRNGFEILDVEHGLTFDTVPVGGKANIYKMAGSKTTVNFALYGAGLGWHRTLFDDREYWTLEDNARAFRNQAAKDKAQVFYDLIDAIGSGQNLAWQAVTGSIATTDNNYVAIRDMNTINKAAETILLAVKDKGYGVTPKSPFVVLSPIQLMGRINRALGLLNAGVSGSAFNGVQYNVRPVYSMMLDSSSTYYVCLPGVKNKAGIRMNLTVFDQFDAVSYSDVAVGWMRFGGAIGDTDQWQRCATS